MGEVVNLESVFLKKLNKMIASGRIERWALDRCLRSGDEDLLEVYALLEDTVYEET